MISDTFPANLKRSLSEIPLHRVFFIFFLFSLPFSIRKVFGILSADGVFNEYADISVYLSDILLIATFIIYILENKSSVLSIEHWKRMFHVEHLLSPIFIPLFFIVWSGLSTFWSESISLALATFIKLVEGYALYLYILISNVPRGTKNVPNDINMKMFHVEHLEQVQENVPRGTLKSILFECIRKCSTWNNLQMIFVILIISAFFQSVIAILQFIQQQSLGLTFLKESVFSVYDPGVAKVLINGDVFVRSYGSFPHPNVLGGFLAVSLLITMAYPLIFRLRMFHVEHSLNIWLYRVIIFIQLAALFLSFSKSALAAYAIGTIMLLFGIRKMFHVEHNDGDMQNVPRGTLKNMFVEYVRKCSTWNIFEVSMVRGLKKMFHVEHLVIIVGIALLGMVLVSFNLKFLLTQPFMERLFYIESLQDLYQAYFFQGLGIGQFVLTMQQFFDEKLLAWQFQPIHNVFLLIFSEGGIVGLGLFLWFFIYAILKNNAIVPRGTFVTEQEQCSTWNNSESSDTKLFHVEHSSAIQLGGDSKSSRKVIVTYLMRSLLAAIAIIMLFDHYFWDIQQGQLVWWIILGLAVSRK